MKEQLKSLVRSASTPLQGTNLVREYLQARMLATLQKCGAMLSLAFQGGTALRFLFSIPRYSEDLDFALERPAAGYDFRRYLQAPPVMSFVSPAPSRSKWHVPFVWPSALRCLDDEAKVLQALDASMPM